MSYWLGRRLRRLVWSGCYPDYESLECGEFVECEIDGMACARCTAVCTVIGMFMLHVAAYASMGYARHGEGGIAVDSGADERGSWD